MGKKHGKTKLPKKLGGIELPKGLRKAGSRLIAKAGSPAGREMIAAGLALAAAVAREASEKGRRERNARERPAGEKRDEAPGTERAASPALPSGAGAAGAPGENAAAGGEGTAKAPGGGNSPAGAIDPHQIGVVLGQMAQEVLGRWIAGRGRR